MERRVRQARVELREANAFVATLHRHHKPVRGHRWSVGAEKDGALVGVAICGRPVARATDQKHVAEILRCCTDGTSNACSFLYGVCARVAKDLGFSRIGTFILAEEDGISLRAAGYQKGHDTSGGDWNCNVRSGRRVDQPMGPKTYYYKDLK